MPEGTIVIARQPAEIVERLRPILAGANCRVEHASPERIEFTHGTYISQSAPLYPKRCVLTFREAGGQTEVHYEIHVAPFMAAFLTLWGILFCFTIFVPVIAYRALVVHPRLFVENLLAGV